MYELTSQSHRRMPSSGMLCHVAVLNSVLQLLVTANIHSSQILASLMREAICSSKMSVLTRDTWRNITEDSILHGHHNENLKSYITITGWAL
jgi:hypothetical protein